MTPTKLKPVEVVVVGMGVAGSIIAKELAASGMQVVGIERGRMLEARHDFAMPYAPDTTGPEGQSSRLRGIQQESDPEVAGLLRGQFDLISMRSPHRRRPAPFQIAAKQVSLITVGCLLSPISNLHFLACPASSEANLATEFQKKGTCHADKDR